MPPSPGGKVGASRRTADRAAVDPRFGARDQSHHSGRKARRTSRSERLSCRLIDRFRVTRPWRGCRCAQSPLFRDPRHQLALAWGTGHFPRTSTAMPVVIRCQAFSVRMQWRTPSSVGPASSGSAMTSRCRGGQPSARPGSASLLKVSSYTLRTSNPGDAIRTVEPETMLWRPSRGSLPRNTTAWRCSTSSPASGRVNGLSQLITPRWTTGFPTVTTIRRISCWLISTMRSGCILKNCGVHKRDGVPANRCSSFSNDEARRRRHPR